MRTLFLMSFLGNFWISSAFKVAVVERKAYSNVSRELRMVAHAFDTNLPSVIVTKKCWWVEKLNYSLEKCPVAAVFAFMLLDIGSMLAIW